VVMSDAAAESRLPLPVPQQDSESAFYLRNNAVMMRESLKESKRLFINGPPGCGKSSEVVLFIADQLRDDSKKKALLIHSPPKPGGSIINVTLIANSQITASPVQLPLSEAAILSLVDHFKPDLLVLDGHGEAGDAGHHRLLAPAQHVQSRGPQDRAVCWSWLVRRFACCSLLT